MTSPRSSISASLLPDTLGIGPVVCAAIQFQIDCQAMLGAAAEGPKQELLAAALGNGTRVVGGHDGSPFL